MTTLGKWGGGGEAMRQSPLVASLSVSISNFSTLHRGKWSGSSRNDICIVSHEIQTNASSGLNLINMAVLPEIGEKLARSERTPNLKDYGLKHIYYFSVRVSSSIQLEFLNIILNMRKLISLQNSYNHLQSLFSIKKRRATTTKQSSWNTHSAKVFASIEVFYLSGYKLSLYYLIYLRK